MPYKISGTLNQNARILVVKQSDWSTESNTEETSGAYEIAGLAAGNKIVTAFGPDDETLSYGGVAAEEYFETAGRGVFGGGGASLNVMDYITISTPGDAADFGDLTVGRHAPGATSNGATDRGIWGGGHTPGSNNWQNFIDYVTISTPANAIDFGDLTVKEYYTAANSNGTNDRGVFGGGVGSVQNIIEYVTISTPGNATDFGDLTTARGYLASTSNATNDRGIWGGGYLSTNVIDYITISTPGNATDFGDLTLTRYTIAATSNGTNDRGIFGGSEGSANIIDYVTISSTGNATDFGDMTVGRNSPGATSNGTSNRGVFGGGHVTTNIIDYVTISTPGDATDFGDLTVARNAGPSATSNS